MTTRSVIDRGFWLGVASSQNRTAGRFPGFGSSISPTSRINSGLSNGSSVSFTPQSFSSRSSILSSLTFESFHNLEQCRSRKWLVPGRQVACFVQRRGDFGVAHPLLQHSLNFRDDRCVGSVHASPSSRNRGGRRCVPRLGRSPRLRLGTLPLGAELRALLLRLGHPILDEFTALMKLVLGFGQVHL